MKKITFLITALVLSATHSYSQLKISKIKSDEKEHYIVNVIGYPIIGVYNFTNQTEPTTILNADGTGIMQNEDLVKENIIWGIECSQSGVPIFKEGFDSASYSLWYRVTGNAKSNTNDDDNWKVDSFSIHYNKRKMFIAGERVKEYVED